MNKFKFIDNHIELLDTPKSFKKMTGTRFATVMGLNAWSTPFEVWCALTKTYEVPFEDTKYTLAGKVIEPKVIDYLKNVYFMDIKNPTEVYGKDYFKKTRGDFFPNHKQLGGMWDALGSDYVVEIKTTKRAEDWENDVPIYYKLQAFLYAYLLGYDKVIVTVSFLEDKDYLRPEDFIPTADNTKTYEFSLSEDCPNFEQRYIDPALEFWRKYVKTGISPDFDEKKDAKVLEELRKNNVEVTDDNLTQLLAEADEIQAVIDGIEDTLSENKKRLTFITDELKKYMMSNFRDGDKKVELNGSKYKWTLSKSARSSVDSKRLKADGLYDKYTTTSEVFTLKKSLIEEDE